MPPARSKPGDLLRVPPVGWRWASVAVDSGCSIHIINDPSVFARLQSTTARVRVADGRSTAMVGEGPVALQTYNSSNQPLSLLLSCALHKPSMKNLLSVSQLMRDGCDITFSHTGAAYITTPSQGQIRLRLDEDLPGHARVGRVHPSVDSKVGGISYEQRPSLPLPCLAPRAAW